MLQTAILVLATLSGSVSQSTAMISNSNNAVTHAKQEISQMRKTFFKTHKLNRGLLLKNLNTIYNSENHQKSNLINLKDGRNGHKWHWWYRTLELWINEEKGQQLTKILKDGRDVSDFLVALAALTNGIGAGVAAAVGLFLYLQWNITWRETDEGSGIHIEIECWGAPYIVYAHAQ